MELVLWSTTRPQEELHHDIAIIHYLLRVLRIFHHEAIYLDDNNNGGLHGRDFRRANSCCPFTIRKILCCSRCNRHRLARYNLSASTRFVERLFAAEIRMELMTFNRLSIAL
uniref:Uncharacterized protein n=1 Tax=Spongospora subterranea TaxID=70186 RepID=A0A0H5RB40_9EUKA|eukprot:CRZ11410.1 hypothetical protein [Spongospora subterranea]